jgi:hypothetical protein
MQSQQTMQRDKTLYLPTTDLLTNRHKGKCMVHLEPSHGLERKDTPLHKLYQLTFSVVSSVQPANARTFSPVKLLSQDDVHSITHTICSGVTEIVRT